MRRRNGRGWMAAALAAFVLGGRVAAQSPLYTVALSGQQAPGAPPGVHYSLLPAPPVVAWPGMVAYWGILEGPGVTPATSTGLFGGTANGPTLLARSGSPAPGTGANYLSFGNPGVAPFGVFVYPADLTGPGVTPDNGQGLFVAQHRSSTPTLYARTGDPAPRSSPGATYSSLSQPSINDGQIAFYGTVTGPGVTDANNEVIFTGSLPGAPRQFVREGQESKAGPGVNYGMLFQPLVTASGTVMFGATLTGNVNSTNDRAIFLDNTPLARKGDVAFAGGATGLHYAELWTYTLNGAGDVAFMADLGGAGVSERNDRALFMGYRGFVPAFAREGDPAPGAPGGVRYGTFFNAPTLNNAREVGYVAALVGEGVTASNDRAVFAGFIERPRMIARTGDRAPGTPEGFMFSGFQEPALAAGGGVFLADLAGPGVSASNDLGMFSFDYRRGLSLIVREGGVVDLGNGDLRTVADEGIGFVVGRSNRTPSGLDGGTAWCSLSGSPMARAACSPSPSQSPPAPRS